MGKFRVLDENGDIVNEFGEKGDKSNLSKGNAVFEDVYSEDYGGGQDYKEDYQYEEEYDEDYRYDDFQEVTNEGRVKEQVRDIRAEDKKKRWEEYALRYDREAEEENLRKITGKREVKVKPVVNTNDLSSRTARRSKKLGEPVNLETNDILREDGKYTEPEKPKQKKDLVLRRTKPRKAVGSSFNVNDAKDNEKIVAKEEKDKDKLVIRKPVRKDLELSRSKFSDKKQDTYSWSMESLGIHRENDEKVNNSSENKKKNKKKSSDKLPVMQLIFGGIFLIFIVGFIVSQKMSGDSGFLSGRDMYPTLDTNSIIKFKDIEDYNTLQYMDIVLFEANGEKIPSRIIGFPGDTVEIRSDGIYLNDEKIDPDLIGGEFDFSRVIRKAPDDYKFNEGTETVLHYQLEEGCDSVILLGDNHQGARDSVTYGPIYVQLIKKVLVK